MEGCILKVNLEGQGEKQHCLLFCCFYPGGYGIFEKEGTSEKRCVEIEDWATSVHFVLGFQESSMQSLSAFL